MPSVDVVAGGSERADSVSAGLGAVAASAQAVLVHDAARPLASSDLLTRVLCEVEAGAEAVVPVLPVVDTVRLSSGSESRGPREGADGVAGAGLGDVVDRDRLRRVQTPQGFSAAALRRAHGERIRSVAPGTGAAGAATDDASLVEALGIPVIAVPGEERALKITTPDDLALVRAFAGASESRTEDGLRIGTGVDVHTFACDVDPATPLMLAGLAWSGERALVGHSDADVAAHACCDALFAAAGLGDLGEQFGTDDPQWAGASGLSLLAEAAARVRAAGGEPQSVSVEIVCARPNISRRREEAQAALSAACGAPVTVAGTTSDGVGLTGQGEGAAAVATALVRMA